MKNLLRNNAKAITFSIMILGLLGMAVHDLLESFSWQYVIAYALGIAIACTAFFILSKKPKN